LQHSKIGSLLTRLGQCLHIHGVRATSALPESDSQPPKCVPSLRAQKRPVAGCLLHHLVSEHEQVMRNFGTPEASGTALIARPGANPPSAAPLSIAAHVIRYLVLTRANSCSVVGTNSACASPTSRRNLHFKRPRRQCLVAAADLPSRPEKRGRKAKDWYDSVLTLLLSIAEKAGIKPTLYKDREAEREFPAGWLLDAARELETFLPAEMRSPSDIARYKRLERSKAKA
jgi:hypothetical protein